MLEDLYIRIF